ncbi:lytic transglycosylase domain-containing protein [Candidatus Fermentibacteria bacterium]|nr:lytic transglycosylase domain-containing protein [Candidatus Fermentibacteria bacterium]
MRRMRSGVQGLILLIAAEGLLGHAAAAARDEVRRWLWLGARPDIFLAASSLLPTHDDSVLMVSVHLATGDSAAAMGWLPARTDTSLPAWEILEARRLLLLRAAGVQAGAQLMALWRRFPATSVGRQCALAALEDAPGLEAVDAVREQTGRWPATYRARAWRLIAAGYDGAGMQDSAAAALWRVVDTEAAPHAGVAAEDLARRIETRSLTPSRRSTLATALLSGGKPQAALSVLPASPATDAEHLLKARCLLAAGRRSEGVAVLGRLSRRGTPIAADALWYLATHQKRVDDDSLAATTYYTLVQRFPSHARAQAAAWEAAWAFERTGQLEKAGSVYREGIRRWPRGFNADNSRFRWGLVAWRSGDVRGALQRWTTTWPYLRDERAKAAVAYWRGKGDFAHGRLDEARQWWRAAEEAGPGSFYGLRAQRRLRAGDMRTRAPLVSPRPPRNLGTWLRTWTADTLAVASSAMIRARTLYAVGFAQDAAEELSKALDAAGRSPGAIASVLEQAKDWGSPAIVAVAASRLGERYRSATGQDPPRWMDRLCLPVPFRETLLPIARESALDPSLVSALIRKESFYDRSAVSRAGAVGLMQLMPRTAEETARLAPGLDPERRTEVETNLRLGCLHLRWVLDRHDGNVVHALGAYNAGPDPLRRWMRDLPSGDEELWVECITYGETRYYIKTVLAFAWRYRETWPELRGSNPFESLRVKELHGS